MSFSCGVGPLCLPMQDKRRHNSSTFHPSLLSRIYKSPVFLCVCMSAPLYIAEQIIVCPGEEQSIDCRLCCSAVSVFNSGTLTSSFAVLEWRFAPDILLVIILRDVIVTGLGRGVGTCAYLGRGKAFCVSSRRETKYEHWRVQHGCC